MEIFAIIIAKTKTKNKKFEIIITNKVKYIN